MACEPVNMLQNPGCCEMSARKHLYLQGAFKFKNGKHTVYQYHIQYHILIYTILCTIHNIKPSTHDGIIAESFQTYGPGVELVKVMPLGFRVYLRARRGAGEGDAVRV